LKRANAVISGYANDPSVEIAAGLTISAKRCTSSVFSVTARLTSEPFLVPKDLKLHYIAH
jgi:hypothetical protein